MKKVPRLSAGTTARYIAFVYQAVKRITRDRCPTCGEKPAPFNLMFCERCQTRINAELEKRSDDHHEEE